MAWYAYCIAEQEALHNGIRARRPYAFSNIRGINSAPVMAYPSGDFAVVVSEYQEGAQLDQQAVVDHARVVRECFRISTVLPFRFGTIFESDEALRRAVRTNRRTFLESVAKLRGKAEMHIKVTLEDGSLHEILSDGTLPATVGSEYLMKLRDRAARERERQTKARALTIQVNKLFSPIDEEVSCKKTESGGIHLDIAHLIDSKSIEKYQNRLASASRQFKNCAVSVSGPWPPYHFLPGKVRTVNN